MYLDNYWTDINDKNSSLDLKESKMSYDYADQWINIIIILLQKGNFRFKIHELQSFTTENIFCMWSLNKISTSSS